MEKPSTLMIGRQPQIEVGKNKLILQRLLDVILYLASRNPGLRDKISTLDDVHNGNFPGTLELQSHYDPLIHKHLHKIKWSHTLGLG